MSGAMGVLGLSLQRLFSMFFRRRFCVFCMKSIVRIMFAMRHLGHGCLVSMAFVRGLLLTLRGGAVRRVLVMTHAMIAMT
jgi:hypothetical protein